MLSRSKPMDRKSLRRAWMSVVELLETRALFSSTTVQPLPFALEFTGSVGNDVVDKDGQGTGFTRIDFSVLT